MSVSHATKALLVRVEQLQVPETYCNATHKVDDEILANSIRLTGIQQPLIAVEIAGEKYLVIDGVRRFNIARSLGIHELPCVVDVGIEEADDEVEYRNRIRFILD